MQTVELIFSYFPELTPKQKKQFGQLYDLYTEWNAKINVISRKDIDELYFRHVLHSLGIAKVMTFNKGAEILDVGTGGGFPGIPLAILFPETQFHLVDSIGKKIKVVNAISEALGLENVKAEQIRAENIKGEYDFIISRAVTRLAAFRKWVRNKVKKESNHTLKNGILYLKGGELSEELEEAQSNFVIYNLSDYFQEDFFKTKKVVHVPLKYKSKH
ncbi:16S rRNA (guanine(527)-N(7))-methyltransferase RsmG [Xanthovirga aplysinae]|uniref:16S rRNA (guanine(527)-N(7))-methyltransferase RsmG n=1 Tax=Xanthovirga aplysinae TaxID=2529853 RepID=UPI0012BD3DD1|nr:16S rRNA (guanine(527)-N(7))-methyltransferase RsmG [Xanthovirga aplysinae]MTI29546.1 16S rRNA (guanine(527)-N(7))-methyltransferase RsmG [Xanthovirga aplysinae]